MYQISYNMYLDKVSWFCSQPEGADLSDHNQLGSGVSHPGPRAGQGDVQPAEETV